MVALLERRPPSNCSFFLPPRVTLCLTTNIPGFALYPKERARSRRVGLSILILAGCFLQRISLSFQRSFVSSEFFHVSRKCLYNPIILPPLLSTYVALCRTSFFQIFVKNLLDSGKQTPTSPTIVDIVLFKKLPFSSLKI